MPYRCCVPKCRGNYPNGPKVSVFSFPTEDELRKKWLNGIHRKDFLPSKTSRVCELHFLDNEILRSTTVHDEQTGELLTAPLLCPKLVKGAIPSQAGCSEYLPKPTTKLRESPAERRQRLDSNTLQKALSESMETLEKHNKSLLFSTFQELISLLENYSFNSEWILMKGDESVCFLLIKDNPQPTVQCSVKISNDLSVAVYYRNILMQKLGRKLLPVKIGNLNEIDEIINSCHRKYLKLNVEICNVQECVDNILENLNHLETCLTEKGPIIASLKEKVSLLNAHKID